MFEGYLPAGVTKNGLRHKNSTMGEERCSSGKWKFLLPALKDFDILSSCSGRGSAGTGRLTWTTASPRKRISSTRKRLNTLTRQRGMAKNSRSFRWIVHSELPWRKGDVSAREPTRPAEGMDLHPRVDPASQAVPWQHIQAPQPPNQG